MILASIFINSIPLDEQIIPPIVRENIESFKENHPGIQHILFDDRKIRDLLKSNFDKDVLIAYSSLNPYSYKSDLARYCVLFHFGGIYADLSFYFMKEWLPVDNKLAIFQDFCSLFH